MKHNETANTVETTIVFSINAVRKTDHAQNKYFKYAEVDFMKNWGRLCERFFFFLSERY